MGNGQHCGDERVEDDGRQATADAAHGGSGEPARNLCFDCLDRHVRDGRGAAAAIVYDAPAIAFRKTITYAELLAEVETFAAVLGDFGVGPGDRVVVYLPPIPRAHVAMLACARLGADVATVPGGAPAAELAARLDAVRPKVVLTASCAVEAGRAVPFKPLVDAAIEAAKAKPAAVLVWQRPRCQAELAAGRDHDWEALAEAADGRRVACAPVPVAATSGAADLRGALAPDDTCWCTLDAGTATGAAFGVYAPLLIGAATICYEGDAVGPLDPGAFWRVCAAEGVAAVVTPAATLGALAAADPDGAAVARHDLSRLRTLVLLGADAADVNWAATHLAGAEVTAQASVAP